MKGDKNRGEKLFSKIVLGDKFQTGIQEIRTNCKIPEMGFSEIKDISRWYSKHKSFVEKMEKSTVQFLSKQDLPNNFWWWHKVIEHLLSNGKIKIYPDKLAGQEPFIEVSYKNRARQKAVNFELYFGATMQEVSKLFKENMILGENKKIRAREKSGVASRIIELWPKTKKELGGNYDESKEILISRILKKEGAGHYEAENIKQIYYRTRKSKK